MPLPRKDPELCATIRDRADKWEKNWAINRSLYYEWIDFVMGDQWREDESKLFERYNKIPLIFNKLGVLMNHLLGDQMQNTPNLQIEPGEGVDADTADVRAALIKDISLNSDAKGVYQTCFGQSIVGGYSAYAILTRYKSDFDFEKEPYFISFDDPNKCYWDVSAKTKCKTDGMFAGFKTRMSRKKFRDTWGKDIESQIGTIATTEDSTVAFADDDSITQIDDFERIPKKMTIRRMANIDGSDIFSVDEDEFKQLEKIVIDGKKFLMRNGIPVSVIDKREVVHYTIKHRQIAGDFVLEEEDFPSEQLPLVFVDQKSYYSKQGQQITRSFFKDVKDAQKYLNYLATQSAYLMKVMRYDQFIAPRKAVSSPDVQQMWRDPSVVQGALVYDETPSGATPEKLNPPELSGSLTREYERTLIDIQSGTGMFNTQLGELGNEVSGKAVDARTERGAKNTYVPYNSLNIAIAVGGEIINEMIPHLYNEKRELVLNLPQAQNQSVMINEQVDPYGTLIKNDMTKGRYKIRLKPGPSYEGIKQEALDSMNMVLAADKAGNVFPLIADLYVENLPLDNNIELRNRLRTLVPQEIIEAGKTGKPLPPKPPQPTPEQVKNELKKEEMANKVKQAEAEFSIRMRELAIKESELQRKALESSQDMSMDWEKLKAEREMAAAKLQETLLRYSAEQDRVAADVQISHSQNLVRLLTHNPKHSERKPLNQG